MAKKKFYAVKEGRQTGIFYTWDECQNAVKGYSGAVFKGFSSEEEAIAFLNGDKSPILSDDLMDMNSISNSTYAFVDGSFNPKTNVYGCGGYLVVNEEKIILQGSDNNEEMATMRNVAGELLGATLAIKKAIELGLKELTIYYDYEGIRAWATGNWKRNKKGTKDYYEFIQMIKDKINLTFVHVKGHTGVDGNEDADRLAKEAVGI